MMKFLYFMSLLMSMMFLNMNHPLSLGLILILQAIISALILGGISQTFWFSYILFLVIIGGMLIIFLYVISLIFNKIFFQNFNYSILLYMVILVLLIYLMFKINKLYATENSLNYNLMEKTEISFNLIKLYNFPMNTINLLMIMYLFFLLIVVVKITNFFYGPLRMKM